MGAIEGDGTGIMEPVGATRESLDPSTVAGIDLGHRVAASVRHPQMGAVEGDLRGMIEPVGATAVRAAPPVEGGHPREIRLWGCPRRTLGTSGAGGSGRTRCTSCTRGSCRTLGTSCTRCTGDSGRTLGPGLVPVQTRVPVWAVRRCGTVDNREFVVGATGLVTAVDDPAAVGNRCPTNPADHDGCRHGRHDRYGEARPGHRLHVLDPGHTSPLFPTRDEGVHHQPARPQVDTSLVSLAVWRSERITPYE